MEAHSEGGALRVLHFLATGGGSAACACTDWVQRPMDWPAASGQFLGVGRSIRILEQARSCETLRESLSHPAFAFAGARPLAL